MNAPRDAEPADAAGLVVCGNCRAAMQPVRLPGHYGREVEIDVCASCHLVWFDLTETARLSGPALLELIGRMARAQALPHEPLHAQARCARCGGGLKTVHNRSRWGRSLHLECRGGHGTYQSFAEFLKEKGLLREMSRLDRVQLLEAAGRIDCVNCGAAIGAGDAQCPYCRSVPALLDVARLARALDPEGAIEPHAVHGRSADATALQCAACGAALPPEHSLRCAQCGATLAISRLARAHEAVAALGPALRAHAARPAPEVVARRLAALDADIPRRRAWAAQMEAEAREARGGGEAHWERWPRWSDWSDWIEGLQSHPLRALSLALALVALLWWLW